MEKKLSGTEVSKILYQELKEYISKQQTKPNVVDISIGDDFGSLKYAEMKKEKITKEAGFGFKSVHYDEISKEELINYINKLNEKTDINGIMIQLPLPSYLSEYEREILDTIDFTKDIDGLTSRSAGLLMVGADCLIPCTPLGIITLLKAYDIPLAGKKVSIINRSNIVGKPLEQLFLRENATTTLCHSKTLNLESITSEADILVAALNQREFITEKYVKEGAIIIDVGVHQNEQNKTVGDVDFNSVYEKSSFITPPTGGIGPMTITMLAFNSAKSLYGKDIDEVLNNGIEIARKTLKRKR